MQAYQQGWASGFPLPWDAENRLTSVDAVGSQYTFTYNADGQRVAREDASGTKKFIYDFKKVLQETDGSAPRARPSS